MVQNADGSGGPGAPVRLAVAAIFKNEGPYIHEWIAHHRALGVERFYIADNASTDETTATLAALAAAGIVRHLPFPTPPGRPPQQAAYELILRRHGGEAEWIAFLDGDEFLVPAEPHRTLAAMLDALDPGPDVGVIAVNWAVYGSSGLKAGASAPVAERFTRRAARGRLVNRHYKSIVRPAAVQGKVPNPHYFPLKAGFHAVHVDGTPVVDAPNQAKGLSSRIVWEPLRINHYIVKSWEEFYYRKRARGRAAKAGAERDASFFEALDHNDAVEPMPAWLVAAAAAEGRALDAAVQGRLPVSPDGGQGVEPRGGAVEGVEIHGEVALVRGWARTPRGGRVADFSVEIAGRPAPVASLIRVRRSDVLPADPGAGADCGFNLRVAWPPGTAIPAPLAVTARPEDGSPFVLASSAGMTWRDLDRPGEPPVAAAPGAAGKAAPPPAPPREVPAGTAPGGGGAPRVPSRPSMPPAAVARLTAGLEAAGCYLEYGTGGSTVLAASLDVGTLIAVESDRDWLTLVRDRLDLPADTARRFLLHADIGPTKALGYPVSAAHWQRYRTYAMMPWTLCRQRGLVPDLVLVDGRFRVACFLASLLHARPGCAILFDDYAERPYYHTVTRFLPRPRMIDRMAEFAVPPAFDRDAVWEALLQAVTDTR